MSQGKVFRCGTCGAPLNEVAGKSVVSCLYCENENHLEPAAKAQSQEPKQHARFAQAGGDPSAANAKDHEAQSEALMRKFEKAQERAMTTGDREAARRAVRHFEGYMRLQYAPTIEFCHNQDPDNPQVVQTLQQIDETIDQACRGIAASLGMEYVPAEERLRSDE